MNVETGAIRLVQLGSVCWWEGGIHGNTAPPPRALVTLKQSVESLLTCYLPQLVGEGGESYSIKYTKQNGRATKARKEASTKQPQGTTSQILGCSLKGDH